MTTGPLGAAHLSGLTTALAERYRLAHELGAGGMATVWLAEDVRHERRVAIKVLHPALSAVLGPERFLVEIKTTANLQHPHILPLFDSGSAEGLLYYVMPYVDGETLRARLERERQLPIADAVRIAREVADALDYAHRHGVVHRDVKPENILLHDGRALVADFGIALAVQQAGSARLTQTGLAVGTPTYMSPEQAAGASDLDGRSDVYSLGCMLYEMLVGAPPFTGATPQATIAARFAGPAADVRTIRSEVPALVASALARALAREPDDRFPSADAFLRELSGDPTPARPAGAGWRWVLALAATVLVVLGGASVWSFVRARADAGAPRPTAAEMDRRRTVAVLPFENLSGDSSQAWFAAGMTEEIAAQLSRVSALRLMHRSAAAPYLGAADRLRRLEAELGVGHALEGSVRRAGDQVRITVRLTDTRSGVQVWGGQYDRDLSALGGVFAVQGQVAQEVAARLDAALSPEEAGRLGREATSSRDAYDLLLRTREISKTIPTENARGIAFLRQAVGMDSSFAPAWAELARRHLFLAGAQGPAWVDSAHVAADRALAADQALPEAHYAHALVLTSRGEIDASRLAFLRALELDPNHALAMSDLSMLEAQRGRFDESHHWGMRALRLAPNQFMAYHAAIPLILLGDDDEARRLLEDVIARFPGARGVHRLEMQLAQIDFVAGRGDLALRRARTLADRYPGDQEAQRLLAELAVATGAADARRLIEPLYDTDPDLDGWLLPETMRAHYARVLWREGERTRAERLWREALAAAERAIEDGAQGPGPRLQAAASLAVLGDTSASLEWLERAYDAGWRDVRLVARDPFLGALRDHPKFRTLVTRAARDVAEMRRRAGTAGAR